MARGRNGHLLVDGSNCCHGISELRGLLAIDAESGRRRFEAAIRWPGRVVVFWDGGPGGQPGERVIHGLHVDYSGHGSADDRLVRWLQAHPDRRPCTVISADRHLGDRVRHLGARVLDPQRWWRGMQRRNRPSSSTDADRGPPPAHEVEDWIRWFDTGQ